MNGGAKRAVVVTGSVYDGDAFSATSDSWTMINISCFVFCHGPCSECVWVVELKTRDPHYIVEMNKQRQGRPFRSRLCNQQPDTDLDEMLNNYTLAHLEVDHQSSRE